MATMKLPANGAEGERVLEVTAERLENCQV
jgi:hypothetical protein